MMFNWPFRFKKTPDLTPRHVFERNECMAYIYEGVLTEHVADSAKRMLQDYPFAVEITGSLPTGWVDANLQTYDWWQESDMDSKMYPRNSTLMGWHFEHSGPGSPSFLYLKTEEDRRRIIAAFPDQIVNASPFRTIIL